MTVHKGSAMGRGALDQRFERSASGAVADGSRVANCRLAAQIGFFTDFCYYDNTRNEQRHLTLGIVVSFAVGPHRCGKGQPDRCVTLSGFGFLEGAGLRSFGRSHHFCEGLAYTVLW